MKGFDLGSEGFEDWLREMRAQDAAIEITPAPSAAPRSRPAVAVLPFAELGVADTDMFADGVVEEITGALSRVRDFHVIARQSAFALQGDRLTVPDTARKLGVQYLVEGTVRRAGDRVRITAQLVHGLDGRTLWSERFDDHLDDLFDLQDRIAARIAGQISPTLRDAEIRRASAIPPDQQSAYSLTLQALPHFWAHRPEENRKAIEIFERALAISPDYWSAMAYSAWALTQQTSYMWSAEPEKDRAEALRRAEICAQNSFDHAPTLAAISAVYSMSFQDQKPATAFAHKALELDPNYAWGWMRLGWAEVHSRKPRDAIQHFQHAESLSPLDPFLFNMRIGRAVAHSVLGEVQTAVDILEATVHATPGLSWIYRELALYNTRLGKLDEAVAAAKLFLKANPDMTIKKIKDSAPHANWLYDDLVPGLLAAGVPQE